MNQNIKEWAREKYNKENELYSLNYAINSMNDFFRSNRCSPRPSDVKSYNTIIYNLKSENLATSQEPFAKLYLFLYLQYLRKRNDGEQNIRPARIVTDILKNDISILIQEIHQEIKSAHIENIFQENVSSEKYTKDMSDEEREKTFEEFKNIDLEKLTKTTDYETVSKTLINKINDILFEYK